MLMQSSIDFCNNYVQPGNNFWTPLPPQDAFMFTKEQIECVCEVLCQSGKSDRLSRFLWSLPMTSDIQYLEAVLKAKAVLAYHEQDFFELYKILENNKFSVKNHEKLQELWVNGRFTKLYAFWMEFIIIKCPYSALCRS